MNPWLLSYFAGGLVIGAIWLVNKRYEREQYCDHGPSVYDSYCDKCGLDSE
jgi:hypothetical protein